MWKEIWKEEDCDGEKGILARKQCKNYTISISSYCCCYHDH